MEILAGGTGSDSKLSRMIKPVKDTKAGKGGGKDAKTPVGGGAAVAADDDKAKAGAAEVLPVDLPPVVRKKFCSFQNKIKTI